MSKTRKRLRKAIMGAAALYGASKLMGKGAMPFEHEGSVKLPDDRLAKAKKAMTSDAAYKKPLKAKAKTYVDAIMKLDRKDLPEKRNMKSIFVNEDGTITKGLRKFENKDVFSKTMKAERKAKKATSMKDFMNKYILGSKTQIGDKNLTATEGSMKKGGILKARGGVEVKTKLNGKLYTQTF